MRGRGPFNSFFPDELFGCPFSIFLGLVAFWIIFAFIGLAKASGRYTQDEEILGTIIGGALALLSAWLWGKYGYLVLWVVGGIALVFLIIFLINKLCDYPDDVFRGIVIVLLIIGVCIFFYFHIVEEMKEMIFSLPFLYKSLSVIGVLGLICLLGWLGLVFKRKRREEKRRLEVEERQERERQERERRERERQERDRWREGDQGFLGRVREEDIQDIVPPIPPPRPEADRRNPIPRREDLGI